jgi:hypothetical protein
MRARSEERDRGEEDQSGEHQGRIADRASRIGIEDRGVGLGIQDQEWGLGDVGFTDPKSSISNSHSSILPTFTIDQPSVDP